MRHASFILPLTMTFAFGLAGCASIEKITGDLTKPRARTAETQSETPTRRPPPAARTVEEFDTTTAEEREEASAAPATASGGLGSTIAALGDPAVPGFWIKTPLADKPGKGRVVFPPNGRTVQVDLIPLEGADTSGSQLSLAAMRLLDVPLTDLPEVEVYAN